MIVNTPPLSRTILVFFFHYYLFYGSLLSYFSVIIRLSTIVESLLYYHPLPSSATAVNPQANLLSISIRMARQLNIAAQHV